MSFTQLTPFTETPICLSVCMPNLQAKLYFSTSLKKVSSFVKEHSITQMVCPFDYAVENIANLALVRIPSFSFGIDLIERFCKAFSLVKEQNTLLLANSQDQAYCMSVTVLFILEKKQTESTWEKVITQMEKFFPQEAKNRENGNFLRQILDYYVIPKSSRGEDRDPLDLRYAKGADAGYFCCYPFNWCKKTREDYTPF